MNILVCIKQVPDTTEIRMDPKTNTLIRAGVPSTVNPFDKYALEAAVPANFNLISMEGDRMGVQSFFGQGAGRYPTAYNVVQDLVDIRRGVHAFYTDSFVPAVPDNSGVQHRYYVRTRAAAGAGRPRRGRLGRCGHHAARAREPDARAHGAGAGAGQRELLCRAAVRRAPC